MVKEGPQLFLSLDHQAGVGRAGRGGTAGGAAKQPLAWLQATGSGDVLLQSLLS